MSQPYYRFYFRLNSDEAAKKASATIGKKTVRRWKMTFTEDKGKWRKSWTPEKEEVSVVPDHVLLNLDDRVFYATSPGKITRGELPIIEMPDRLPLLKDREIPDMIRRLPPRPLQAPQAQGPAQPAPEPVALLGQNHF